MLRIHEMGVITLSTSPQTSRTHRALMTFSFQEEAL